ncbi:MAG: peptidase sortase [Nocardioidaceae bacterium]|nr:peptidase sortase [Nocardioidaceae bacterium]
MSALGRLGTHLHRRSWWLVAAACTAVLAAVLVLRSAPGSAVARPLEPRRTTPLTVTEAVPAREVGAVRPEPPADLRLPDGTVVPVRPAATRADGILDVPEDIRTAGWWPGGSRIGDPLGSTLVAAHIDSTTQGLGPYAVLLGARANQQVVVRTSSLVQTFRIVSLRLVPQGSLADDAWIYSPSGKRRLVLVTCAPPYDRAHGGYQNLAVVTAIPTGPPTTRSR